MPMPNVVGTAMLQCSFGMAPSTLNALPKGVPVAAEAADRGGRDPDLDRVEEDLRQALGTKVSLARTRRGGRIVIEYYSDEELGRLYDRLTGGTA